MSDETTLLHERLELLSVSRERVIVGLCGAPGAGKSVLAERLVAEMEDRAALLPMDGFHLAHQVIAGTEWEHRRGAPETFDADGYINALARARQAGQTLFVPEYRRDIEDPVAGALRISAGVPIVVTEGNYLLLDREPWSRVTDLVDEIWFVEITDEATRRSRLIQRHMRFGSTAEHAERRVTENDDLNAGLVADSARRADYIVGFNQETGYLLTPQSASAPRR